MKDLIEFVACSSVLEARISLAFETQSRTSTWGASRMLTMNRLHSFDCLMFPRFFESLAITPMSWIFCSSCLMMLEACALACCVSLSRSFTSKANLLATTPQQLTWKLELTLSNEPRYPSTALAGSILYLGPFARPVARLRLLLSFGSLDAAKISALRMKFP